MTKINCINIIAIVSLVIIMVPLFVFDAGVLSITHASASGGESTTSGASNGGALGSVMGPLGGILGSIIGGAAGSAMANLITTANSGSVSTNPASSEAQTTNDTTSGSITTITLPSSIPSPTWGGNLNSVVGYFAGFFLGILGLGAFFGIIYSGFMMITSAGDAAKFATARKNIVWAITGIVVAILAFLIVSFASSIAQTL